VILEAGQLAIGPASIKACR